MLEILKYPAVIATGFAVCFLLTPVVRKLAIRVGLVDQPGARRIHKTAVPRGGGIAVYFGFHAACAAALLIPWNGAAGSTMTPVIWLELLFVTTVILVLGLVDDVTELQPFVKLAGQVAAGVLGFSLNMRFGGLLGIDFPIWLDLLITVFWFVAIINAFNLIDGIDGLACGLAGIAALGIAGSLIFSHRPLDALVLCGLVGACLAFLRFNFSPATVFLGDGGSMFLGCVIAATALLTSSKTTTVTALGVPVLAVGIPLFDTILAIWRRVLRGLPGYIDQANGSNGKSGIFDADQDHLHHRLLKSGLSQRSVASWLYVASFAIVGIGLASFIYTSRAVGIYLLAFLVLSYVVFRHLAKVELWDSGSMIVKGLKRPPTRVLSVLLYPPLDMLLLTCAFTTGLVVAKWGGGAGDIKQAWFSQWPIWVGMPFAILAASGVYRRVWSRARVWDYAVVAGTVIAGVIASVAIILLWSGWGEESVILCAFVYGSFAVVVVTGIRAVPRALLDRVALRNPSENRHAEGVRHTLLYGGGYHCTLFLRWLSFDPITHCDSQKIVGVMDDDRNLHSRYVYGYKVLGGIEDVPRVIEAEHVDQVVITTTSLDANTRERLKAITESYSVALCEWQTSLVQYT